MEDKQFELLRGTTAIGLICEDGVILAADTRAIGGHLIASKRAKKLYKITDNIGVSVSGGVGDTQSLIRILRGEANYFRMREGTPMKVGAAAKLTANVLYQYSRLSPYMAVLLVAGIDESGPKLCTLGVDGSLVEEEKVAVGSGSPIAHGILESEFERGMQVDDAIPIATKALKSAMKRDIATGNEINVVTLTGEGYRELPPEEIKNFCS